MMTLLMVLFIVMFAISQVDQTKFDDAQGRHWPPAFGNSASPFDGQRRHAEDAEGIKPLDPVRPDAPLDRRRQEPAPAANAAADRAAAADDSYDKAAKEVDQPRGARRSASRRR